MEDLGKKAFRGFALFLVICFIIGLSNGSINYSPQEKRIEYAIDGWVTKYLTPRRFNFNDLIPTPYKSNAYIYRVAFYKNGMPVVDSLVTDYDMKTGEKIDEKHLIRESPDVIVGKRTYYYHGRITSVANYVNGKREGEYLSFNENMRVTFKGNYTNGVLQGKVYRYLDNGKLSKVTTYVDGKVNGYCEYYDDNGNLITKGNYIEVKDTENANISKGQPRIRIVPYSGEHISYYPNGKVRSKGQFQNMKQVGIWYFYDERGNLSTKDFTPKPIQYRQPQRSRNDPAYDRGYDRGWQTGYEDAMNGNIFQASFNCNRSGAYLDGYQDGYQDGWDNGKAERKKRANDEDE